MTEATNPETPVNAHDKRHWHMAHARVMFNFNRRPMAAEVQFLTMADVPHFTASRLTQLQNQAAFVQRQKMQDGARPGEDISPKFEVIDVVFLGFIPLGEMSLEEFHDGTPPAPNAEEVSTH